MALEDLEKIDWLAQEDEQDKGYIVNVDLEYQAELHDDHNDYPLATQRIQVRTEWLSKKCCRSERIIKSREASRTQNLYRIL